MQAPKAGKYTRGGVTLDITRENSAFLVIVANGQTFTFNQAGVLMDEARVAHVEDEQSDKPRTKVPKPPVWR